MTRISVQVLKHDDRPPATPITGIISESGGTLGRGKACNIVLDDPNRVIARRHLQFNLKEDEWWVHNLSDASVSFVKDETELRPNASCLIQDRAEMIVGEYVLLLRVLEEPDRPDGTVARGEFLDLDDSIFGARSGEGKSPPEQDSGSQGASFGNWDDALLKGLMQSPDLPYVPQSVPPGNPKGKSKDPGGAPLEALLGNPNALDPLAVLGGGDIGEGILDDLLPPPGREVFEQPSFLSGEPGSDHAVSPPAAFANETPAASDSVPEIAPHGGEAGDHGGETGDLEAVPLSGGSDGEDEPEPGIDAAALPPPASTKREPPYSDSRRATSPSIEEDLYRAFLEGLGVDLRNRTVLDRDFMKMLGRILSIYTEGFVALIHARTMIKKTVGANLTVMKPNSNNPFKFSPNAEVALAYLLGNPITGFMGPLEAIKNSIVDLRAHQIAVVSGMQSALNQVLNYFDPAKINRNVKPKGWVDEIPVFRNNRLWQIYRRYFESTRKRAMDRDGFHGIFGTAFRAAYEKAVAKLEAGQGQDD